VKKIHALALASFGVEKNVKAWPFKEAPEVEAWGAEDRKALEERLVALKGKTFTHAIPPEPAWQKLKADPKAAWVGVPPETRVLDFADKPTCAQLQLLHGAETFLWIVIGYGISGDAPPSVSIRLQAVVFNREAQVVWMNVYDESCRVPGEAPLPDRVAVEEAMKRCSRQAIEHVAAALEGQ